MRNLNMIGNQYGRWTVVNLIAPHGKERHWYCECICQCGTQRSVSASKLRQRKTLSCGCYAQEVASTTHRTHGQSRSREYGIWANMIRRCTDANDEHFADYGGRGISVCNQWLDFSNFWSDMGPRPSAKHSIDRIDFNGNYCPENCRWATMRQQQNNRRNNRTFLFQGKMVTAAEAARMAGNIVSATVAIDRVLTQGWTIDRAVTTPKLKRANGPDGRLTWRNAPEHAA